MYSNRKECALVFGAYNKHIIFSINLISCLVYKMSEKGDKVFPDAENNVLICLVLSTTQTYFIYCLWGVKKPENIHIWNQKIWQFILGKVLKLINWLAK